MLLDGSRPWVDPELTSLHRLPVTPAAAPCPDVRTARRHDPAASPWWVSLDGTWDFTMLARPERLRRTHLLGSTDGGREAAGTIEVPGAWTLQGHGHPHYTNIPMPFGQEPPLVPEDNPTGVYRRTLTVPRAWKGRRTVLRVGGAESMVCVYLDGGFVGCATDSRLASDFDLTEHVGSGGRHTLALVVLKWSAASWLEDQDQWWHGGLQRSVALYSTAGSHLSTLALVPGLALVPASPLPAGAEVTGALSVEVNFDGPLRREPGWAVEVRVESLRGSPLATTGRLDVPVWDDSTELMAVMHGMLIEPGTVRARLEVPGVRPWSHESPSLYRTVVVLRDPAGATVEVRALRLGFRHVEVRDRELLVNGAPVVIRGVNIHEHDPSRGRAVTTELARADLVAAKAANLNAVRGAHYPHAEHFAELCDELGLYLVDEANVETHARQASLCHDPRFGAAIVERVERMARRDIHHPSVIMWSLGNESGYGPPHDEAAAFLRRFDPSRPLHYEGPFMHDLDAEAPVSDVVCPMYSSVDSIVHWARRGEDPRPLILCEYSHAMGNACGSLADYDDAFETVDGLQGGFIWEWLEHGIPLPDRSGPRGGPVWGYGGDFGDRPNDAGFVCDGLLDAGRTPHPAVDEVRWLGRPVRCALEEATGTSARIGVANRRWFTDTADLDGRWVLRADGEEVAGGALEIAALAPRATVMARVRWPAAARVPGAEHHLEVQWRLRRPGRAPARGALVGWDQWPVPAADRPGPRWAGGGDREEPSGPAFEMAGGWRPALFRALTDNDGIRAGWMRGMNGSLPRWVDQLRLDRVVWDAEAGTLGAPGAVEPLVVRSRVADAGGGWVRLAVELDLPAELADPPRLGILWELPGELEVLEWLGDGPGEGYPDRRSATRVGRWRSSVWDQYVDFAMPQEHGHHTGLRWVALRPRRGGAGMMVVAEPAHTGAPRPGFSARHHSDAELWAARHNDDLAAEAVVATGSDRPPTWLAVDVAQRGLGQSSLGFETYERYRIPAGEHRLELLLRSFDPRREDPGELYRRRPG